MSRRYMKEEIPDSAIVEVYLDYSEKIMNEAQSWGISELATIEKPCELAFNRPCIHKDKKNLDLCSSHMTSMIRELQGMLVDELWKTARENWVHVREVDQSRDTLVDDSTLIEYV